MSEDAQVIVLVDDWSFGYPQRPVLQGWSVRVRSGVSLLQGGDGAGKTTVLRLLAGALVAQSGSAALLGQPYPGEGAARSPHVYWVEPRATGLDALAPDDCFARWAGRYPLWDGEALQRHVQGFGLAAHLHKAMSQLSTGTQRKVLMAAGLASGAALTLLDEPVAGLDRPSIAYLQHALAQETDQSGRAIVVAHYEALPGIAWRDTWVLPG